MGALFVIFAVAMAAATFIENDFGSEAAYSSVYNTRWFELILILLAVNLTGQIIIFKMFRKEKLPMALFHLAFIIMIAGAGITRYFGWEGTIHIREGEMSDVCYSDKEYLGYQVTDAEQKVLSEHYKPYTLTNSSPDFKTKVTAGNKEYEIVLSRIISNAAETVADDPTGEPIISLLVIKDMMSRENIVLKEGENIEVQGITIGFNASGKDDVRIALDSGAFFLRSEHETGQMSMMTGESVILSPGSEIALMPMQVITVKDIKIVPQKMTLKGSLKAVAADPEEQNTGRNALIFHVFSGNETESVTLWTSSDGLSVSETCAMDGNEFEISYGSKPDLLPFKLHLNDFVLERYPGSNSPSGYRSNVTLIDNSENVERPFSIYMNNVLKYKGYRFYQSSYDSDEKGTILSVSHDFAGMIVTYTGYGLLFLFIILSLINRNSSFRTIRAGAWSSHLRKTLSLGLFIAIASGLAPLNAQKFEPSREGAAGFGKVLVQDQKGRTKPLYTLSSDILRKVSRENKFDGYTSMQVFLGLYFDFDRWKDVPLIRVSSKDLQKILGIRGNMASFSDLVNMEGNGAYKLSDEVNSAYEKSPGERSKLDKEVMKVDERVNIVYMIYKGDFTKIFPLKDGTTNWGSAEEALRNAATREDSVYLESIVPLLSEALQLNNRTRINQICESITGYQKRFAGYELPSETRIKAENLYYRLGIFEKLFPFYAR